MQSRKTHIKKTRLNLTAKKPKLANPKYRQLRKHRLRSYVLGNENVGVDIGVGIGVGVGIWQSDK